MAEKEEWSGGEGGEAEKTRMGEVREGEWRERAGEERGKETKVTHPSSTFTLPGSLDRCSRCNALDRATDRTSC